MDYVNAGGLHVASALYDFVNAEAIPGTGIDADRFWRGPWCADPRSGTTQPGIARQARCAAAPDRRVAPQQPRQADGPAPISSSCAASAIWSPSRLISRSPPQRRSRDRQHRRSAACRAVDQCPLCVECRECALGQPVRRAVRDRRDPGGRRRRRAAPATTRSRGARVVAKARQVLDQAVPLAIGSHGMPSAMPRRRPALGRSEGQCADRACASGAVHRLSRRRRRSIRCAAEAQRPAHRNCASTAATRSARTMRPASPTWCWRRQSPRSRTARIRSPRSMPTTRCSPTATGSG